MYVKFFQLNNTSVYWTLFHNLDEIRFERTRTQKIGQHFFGGMFKYIGSNTSVISDFEYIQIWSLHSLGIQWMRSVHMFHELDYWYQFLKRIVRGVTIWKNVQANRGILCLACTFFSSSNQNLHVRIIAISTKLNNSFLD